MRYIYHIKFRMLEMRENEIALRTFEGTLVARTFDVIVA